MDTNLTSSRYGKSFNQFCEFKKQIEKEDAVLIIGENYVVMSINYYKKMGMVEENKKLRESLKEISKGEGAYSMDQLEHANNTIENMKQIAKNALGG